MCAKLELHPKTPRTPPELSIFVLRPSDTGWFQGRVVGRECGSGRIRPTLSPVQPQTPVFPWCWVDSQAGAHSDMVLGMSPEGLYPPSLADLFLD